RRPWRANSVSEPPRYAPRPHARHPPRPPDPREPPPPGRYVRAPAPPLQTGRRGPPPPRRRGGGGAGGRRSGPPPAGPARGGGEGRGADELPVDGSDLIGRVMGAVAGRMSLPIAPHMRSATTTIPLARGLGSSSAATVAAICLASALLDLGIHDDRSSVFALA